MRTQPRELVLDPFHEPDVASLRPEAIDENPPPVRRPDGVVDAGVGLVEREDLLGLARRSGETHSALWPTTSMTREKSGEKDMCAAASDLGERSGLTAAERRPTSSRFAAAEARKTTASQSLVHRRKCPAAPTCVSCRAPLPSALITQTSRRPLPVRLVGDLPSVGREEGIDLEWRRVSVSGRQSRGRDIDGPDVRVPARDEKKATVLPSGDQLAW